VGGFSHRRPDFIGTKRYIVRRRFSRKQGSYNLSTFPSRLYRFSVLLETVDIESDTLKCLVGQTFLLVNYADALDLHFMLGYTMESGDPPGKWETDQRGL
jgi:hypothetical protein